MAAWGYEFYFLAPMVFLHAFAVLTRERYHQHSKIKFVSLRDHVIFSIYDEEKEIKNRQNTNRYDMLSFKWSTDVLQSINYQNGYSDQIPYIEHRYSKHYWIE